MRGAHNHTESEAVAEALRAALPVPSRTRVYTLTCGCPDSDGQLFWNIDAESRSYELVVACDAVALRDVRLTSTPRFGDGPVWETGFLIRDTSSRWPDDLAQLVGRLTLPDRTLFIH